MFISIRKSGTSNFASVPGAVATSSQENQGFAAGYRHCINIICAFLNSAGTSLSQDIKYKILHQLEETLRARPSMTSIPISKVWHHHRTALRSSFQPLLPWAALPPPHHLSSGPRFLASASSTPQISISTPRTQPTSPVTTIPVWRPWWKMWSHSK